MNELYIWQNDGYKILLKRNDRNNYTAIKGLNEKSSWWFKSVNVHLARPWTTEYMKPYSNSKARIATRAKNASKQGHKAGEL